MRWPPPADWPMAATSQQILHRPHRWHVQESGTGPTILLIHGAGGATQSWRGLFPILARNHHVIAIDLPGQGFSQLGAQQRCGLPAMAHDIASLIRAQGWSPDRIIGHSAGAAIALQLTQHGIRPPRGITGLNAALQNFSGVAGWLFPALAKTLALTPFSANLVAATASTKSIRNLIKGTGSTLDPVGEALYLRLMRDAAHLDATLSMMAQWSLDTLLADLPNLHIQTHLIATTGDRAVPVTASRDAAARLPDARLTILPDLGHLAHEESPDLIAHHILTA